MGSTSFGAIFRKSCFFSDMEPIFPILFCALLMNMSETQVFLEEGVRSTYVLNSILYCSDNVWMVFGMFRLNAQSSCWCHLVALS
jgi:hypothetical protein